MIPKLIYNNETSENEKKHLFKLQFFPRRSANNCGIIYCHISINRKRTKSPFSALLKIPLAHWDNKAQVIIGDGYKIEKNDLSRIRTTLYEIFLKYTNKGIFINAEKLKELYFNRNHKEYTILDIYNKWLLNMKT